MTAVRAGRRTVEISKPDKVLFPDPGVTKLELAEYYVSVARWMLPHVKARPLNLWLYPDGIERRGIVRQQIPDHFPEWIERVTVDKAGGTVTHAVCNDPATLAYLANQACITPHNWLSRVDRLHRPDRMIFDLDPSGEDFASIRAAARDIGELLGELGLAAYAMTSGSRGIHVVSPLRRTHDFDTVRAFSREIARLAADRDPARLTVEQRKAKRGGRILVDVMRNAYAQTAVPPYAVRAKPGAPVATPLHWAELSDRGLAPGKYTVRNVFERLERDGDPWDRMAADARSVGEPRRRLRQLQAG